MLLRVRPGKKVLSKNQHKRWYGIFYGYVPKEWRQRPAVTISEERLSYILDHMSERDRHRQFNWPRSSL